MGVNLMKIGILTFHNSYNCGSMMQTFALQRFLTKQQHQVEIIDFSNEGQKKLYSTLYENNSVKNVIKNIIILPKRKRISRNYESFEQFKRSNFNLTKHNYTRIEELSNDEELVFDAVITGSDQVWNITIEDSDDAYFLSWVKKGKKIAYAPSFGSKNIAKYAKDVNKYKSYLALIDYVSVREKNGQRWISDLINKNVPILPDPTLLLDASEYKEVESVSLNLPKDYIFYYSPGYQRKINKLVCKIAKKYKLPVIAFNSKTFYVKFMQFSGFTLPEVENPSTYLQLIKNAKLIITTSFHGTVFSSIYKKCFWTIKNGGMFGDDDRVLTLIEQLNLEDRLISDEFNSKFDYQKKPSYDDYDERVKSMRIKALRFLEEALSSKV